MLERLRAVSRDADALGPNERRKLIEELSRMMKEAARDLEFEKAALLRDKLIELKKEDAQDPGARRRT
jgi:excinuclease ABC subunit B